MQSHFKDSDVLLMAVQLGAISEKQLEECIRERERQMSVPGTVLVKAVHTVAIEKGFLTEKRILEIAGEQKRSGEGSSITIQIEMSCVPCGADYPLSLLESLARPRCAKCGALLTLRPIPGETVRSYSGPLPAEALRALENPKNRFGKYVLLTKLGQGGMGEVFKAWDTVLGRAVALKMPRSVGDDEIRRLYLEAQGAGRLSHPNIAQVYEIGENEGRHYIAMQYIEGITAEQAVAAGGRPPVGEIVRWIRDAALGAHYAHERGVIHRDFKPQNLMIDPEGRVYVMDFGLAKLASDDGSPTVSGAILGTPAFMSPEQASGRSGEIDRRSDIYSLGSSLYVLLSGQKPFDGETVTDILVRVLTTEPRPLREVWPSAPPDLQGIIERSMRRAKAERYATAKEFADELSRFLEGKPVQARPSTIVQRMAKKATRHRGVLVGAGVAALALLAGVYFARGGRADPPPLPPDRLALWSSLFGRIQEALTPEHLREEEATGLLARAAGEFPEQKGVLGALFDREHRTIEDILSEMPRDRWLAERPRVARYLKWLEFAKRPTGKARRILDYRGVCTLEIHIAPFAELRGPVVAGFSPEQRTTPVTLREFEIVDGDLELGHPEFGDRRVRLAGLENGKTYALEGHWSDPDSIRLKEEK
jgi:predicted Ser/Thr protein kinase